VQLCAEVNYGVVRLTEVQARDIATMKKYNILNILGQMILIVRVCVEICHSIYSFQLQVNARIPCVMPK